MISYGAGSRFYELLGGTMLSFYDWYADLPVASTQVFGDQTDVPESGDWFNAGYLMMWGSNIPVTRTPDAHFMTEARYHGQKVVGISPDYADSTKFADEWLRISPGTDGALAMAMGHVILSEFHVRERTPYFLQYMTRFTDSPFLIRLKARDNAFVPGKFLVAADVATGGVVEPSSSAVRDETLASTPHAAFRPLVWDRVGGIADPGGTLADHYGPEGEGRWNLDLSGVDPVLSISELPGAEPVELLLPRFDLPGAAGQGSVGAGVVRRGVPAVRVGDEYLTTVYDVLLAQYAVGREGLPGEWPKGYDDATVPATPAWQEELTGVPAAAAERIGREFARNAEQTGGRSMIGMGAVLMGPNVYLPTYGQSVLGLGAIVAGFVLASLSIGWPLASALSGPVYSRIGFRDAGLAGGALMTAAAFAFLALPDSPSVWLLGLDQVVLGAGFGLLSTPLLVGVQSTVGWDRRGTVTGANIFSRYLGQTLGAALFGAIFNSALRERLTGASPDLRAQLPQHVDEVIDALHGAHLSAPAQQYLREAIGAATAHVYVGLSAIAVQTLLVLLVAPRRFRLADT